MLDKLQVLEQALEEIKIKETMIVNNWIKWLKGPKRKNANVNILNIAL